MCNIIRVGRLLGEKLGLSPEDLPEDMLLSSLDWDSLDFMELAVAMENEFDIRLADEPFSRCRTVGEITELIEAALRG